LIQSLSGNRSDGSLGIVTVSETPTKFSIQKGEIIQTSMQFSNDFASEDVLVSILYSLLDSSRDIGGSARLSGAFRAIAEFLEDFGSEMPTLVVLMANLGSETFDDVKPFLQVIGSRNRYQIEILNLGEEAHNLGPEFKDINVKVHQMTSFAADVFEGYLDLNCIYYVADFFYPLKMIANTRAVYPFCFSSYKGKRFLEFP
jgi:hypothetical protein